MAFHITDNSGEITDGSIYLPKAGSVPIGAPVVGVGVDALKQELQTYYGDRFSVAQPEPAPVVAKPTAKAKD